MSAPPLFSHNLGNKESVVVVWKGSVVNVEHRAGKRRTIVHTSFDPQKAINYAQEYAKSVPTSR